MKKFVVCTNINKRIKTDCCIMKNKIIIISGPPFPTENNLGKTLTALFGCFQKEELCQLYFSPDLPSDYRCDSYYQVTEEQLLKSFFGLISSKCGKRLLEVSDSNSFNSNGQSNRGNRFLVKYKHSTLFLILRNWLWKISKWKNKKLCHWIEDNAPTIIFYVLSNSASRANFVRKLSKKTKCPVVMYVTDDYYHDVRLKSSVFRRLFYYDLQKCIRKMENVITTVVGCSELAAKEFGELLNTKYQTVFTPFSPECNQIKLKEETRQPIIFRYFGNLSLERWKVLRILGESIAKYNEGIKRAFLEVYAPEPSLEILKGINVFNGSQYMGWVSGKKYWELLADADVAVHVESFSEEACRRTRLSISTKIADYLGAGKCILAIGRSDLASIIHLSGFAYVVHHIENIGAAVEDLCKNPKKRFELAKLAREKAVQERSPREVSEYFRQILIDASKSELRAEK